MVKLFIICAALIVLTIGVNGRIPDVGPYDLLEEAQKQLMHLDETVKAALSKSRTVITGRQAELVNHASDIQTTGESRMHTKYMELLATLNTLKGLAATANIDITSCLVDDEPKLANLPPLILSQLESCTSNLVGESDGNNKRLQESLEKSIQEVLNHLTRDLADCNSVLCITSIVREIQNNEIVLPQNIEVETDKIVKLIDVVTLSVEQCLETEVSDFVNQGDKIIEDIGNCVDGLLV